MAAPGRDDPIHIAAGQERLGLAVSAERLREFAGTVLHEVEGHQISIAETFDMAHPAHRAIDWLVAQMVEEDAGDAGFLADKPRVEAYLDAVISTMLMHCRTPVDALSSAAPKDVQLVKAYMSAHLDQPIRLRDLVAVADVPARTFTHHFHSATGLAPMAYLSLLRLSHARALMKSGSVARVTDAALAAGLTHLGRIASRYHAHFGELPSQTLARVVDP